jgi:hypothetical protein
VERRALGRRPGDGQHLGGHRLGLDRPRHGPLVAQRLVEERLVEERLVEERLVEERLVEERLVGRRLVGSASPRRQRACTGVL